MNKSRVAKKKWITKNYLMLLEYNFNHRIVFLEYNFNYIINNSNIFLSFPGTFVLDTQIYDLKIENERS